MILLIACVIISGCFGPHLQKPHSDVPVVYRIGAWSYQPELTVTNFTVAVVDAPLTLSNKKALVRMQIAGTIEKTQKNLFNRPYISKVHVSERFAPMTTNQQSAVADFMVTPVVSTQKTKIEMKPSEFVPFDVKAEMYFETFKWGLNSYVIQCESFKTNIILHQMK